MRLCSQKLWAGPTFWAGLTSSLTLACGARTTLSEEQAAGRPGATPTPMSMPMPVPTTPQVPPSEPAPSCRDVACPDDGDVCNGVQICDPDTQRCVLIEAPPCDDGLLCNGLETCAPASGCASGEPVVCEAPGAYCDEAARGCTCAEPFLAPDCNIKTAYFAVLEPNLRSPARDVAIESDGVWLATDRGVEHLDTGGTPFDPQDDHWTHFDEQEVPEMQALQGVLVGPDGIKYFWGDDRVFALDDGKSPRDKRDDVWVAHETGQALWVSGVLDAEGLLLIVARTGLDVGGTPTVVVFDPGGTPQDASDDTVTSIASGLPGMGRSMAMDTAGQVWLGTEAEQALGNLFHWDRQGTPLDAADDVWTPVRESEGRVWKVVADPTGGVWGTVGGQNGGVFQFFDERTPTDSSDDYWRLYPELGSAMEIAPSGDGWFRMPGGAGILDVGGTPRDPADDAARTLLSPEALRFASDLYTNGTIDEQGRFWVVDESLQVFEVVE